MPHPPRLERPEKVANLTAVQSGESVVVKFTLPRHTTEGLRFTKPLEVEVYRSLVPSGGGMSQLPKPEAWIDLTHDQWMPYAQDDNLEYSVHFTHEQFQAWRGHTLAVAVSTLTRGFRNRPLESDPSNFVDVPIYDVSKPIENVQCHVTEKAIEVQFSPPAETLSGQPIHDLSGYRVDRSLTGKPGSFVERGETHEPPYRDGEFRFGHSYYYQVRAIFGKPGHSALSDASATASVVPRDIFPPAPPQGVTAIYAAGAVELLWNANTETDLAGYAVYRIDGQTTERLNKELLRTPILRDTAAPPGKTLVYYVTAIDLSGNESQASHHVEVETK
jgi:hypothetical protein